MSQYAENVYFGKPCGMMDQASCAVGGFIYVDFADKNAPAVEKLDFDLAERGYSLCITDTGGNHTDLTPDYAAIPAEMRAVAACYGKSSLREVDRRQVLDDAPALRKKLGDRALLRALHFFDENERVSNQVKAIKSGDTDAFLDCAEKSGLSGFRCLQNIFSPGSTEQGIAAALYLSEDFFASRKIKGACRPHGGGFAGTAQAFVPAGYSAEYKEYMERMFGRGSCHILSVRKAGALGLM